YLHYYGSYEEAGISESARADGAAGGDEPNAGCIRCAHLAGDRQKERARDRPREHLCHPRAAGTQGAREILSRRAHCGTRRQGENLLQGYRDGDTGGSRGACDTAAAERGASCAQRTDRVTTRVPPRSAMWLLRQLGPRYGNEALSGDL